MARYRSNLICNERDGYVFIQFHEKTRHETISGCVYWNVGNTSTNVLLSNNK